MHECPPLAIDEMLSPIQLARATNSRFIPGRHFSLLEYEFLETIQPGGWDVLVAMAPPRHGKSYFLSRLVPTWYHSTYPYARTIMCSYALSLVRNASREVRNNVDYLSPAFQNGGVSREARSASDWFMANGIGGCRAAGVGGGITGVGGDLIVIDDYLKNAQQAMNPNIRESQWEWFQSTCFSRLEPGGKLVCLATRWHDDDLIGRLLNFLLKEKGAGALRVREVRLPALSEGLGDPLGRAEGEALWPEKISAEWLGKIQAVNEGYWWNALYQQRTGAHHGNEWPESYFYGIMAEESEWPKKTCRLGAIALDPSKGKNARKGDYQAIVYAGFADGYLWVDAEIERRPVPETIQTMIEMEGDYRPTVSGIESVAFQELLAPIYAAECAKQGRAYLEPELIDNTVNKHIRIARLGSWLRLHMIKIRRTRGGYLLRNMLKEYPNHSHDDGPDALEMAIRLLVSLSDELEHISQLSIV